MATFLHDTFTGSAGTLLSAHTPETGGAWSQNAGSGTTLRIGTAGTNLEPSANAAGEYINAATPGGADYQVEFGLVQHTDNNTNFSGVIWRYDTGTGVHYHLRYSDLTGNFQLYRHDGASYISIGAFTQTLTLNQTYVVRAKMWGSTLRILVDDVEIITTTDSNIAAAGKAGVRMVGTASDSVGIQLTYVTAKDYTGGATGLATAVDAEASGPNLQMNSPSVPDGTHMFAFASTFHAGRTISATGWTLIAGPSGPNSLHVFHRVASGEPQNHTFALTGGNSPTSVGIRAVSGVDDTTPYQTVAAFSTGSSATATAASQTVDEDGSLQLQITGAGGNRTLAGLDAQTEIYDAIEQFGGTGPTLGIHEKKVNAGATGPQSVSLTSGGISWGSLLIIVRPEPAGGATHPLEASANGTSQGTATRIEVGHALAGESIGASQGSATRLEVGHPLGGESIGTSQGTATRLEVGHALAATGNGTSQGTASRLEVGHPLAAAENGTSYGTATELNVGHALAAYGLGSSQGTADLTIPEPPGEHPMFATGIGTSYGTAGDLTVGHPLAAESIGTSYATATRIEVGHDLAAEGIGTSQGTATGIRVGHALAAAATGSSYATADRLEVGHALAGEESGTSYGTAGILVVGHALEAYGIGTSQAEAALVPPPDEYGGFLATASIEETLAAIATIERTFAATPALEATLDATPAIR